MARLLLARVALVLGTIGWLGTACAPGSGASSTEGTAKNGNPVSNCSGLYSKTPSPDGTYYITAFGCYTDSDGNTQGDPGDNCIPACISAAQQSLCSGMSGPSCEESVNWYSADSGRYGCMARLQVTNPQNGKSVVVVVLDAGPSCTVENDANHPVLDMSPPANLYLFGGEQGWSDHALVDVVVVDGATPLGPVTGSSSSSSSTTSSTSSSNGAGGGSGTGAGGGSGAGAGGGSGSGAGGAGGGGTACSSDGDCNPGNDGSGLICVDGTCVPGCDTDAQCPGNTTCQGGQCQ